MNGTQVRALFLTGLMVLSVFAVVSPAAAAGSTDVSLEPGSATVSTGQTTTFDVVVGNADGGVGAFNLTVTSDSNAAIVDATSVTADPTTDISFGANNESVTITGAIADTDNSGQVAIATVTVEGESAGDANLGVSVTDLADEGANSYTVDQTNGATLTVEGEDDGDGGDGDRDPATEFDATTVIQESDAGQNFTVFFGERVAFVADTAGDDINITDGEGRNDGRLIQNFQPENGSIVIDTGADSVYEIFEAEEDYKVFFSGTQDAANIIVEDLDLRVISENQSVTAGIDDINVEATADESNRNITYQLVEYDAQDNELGAVVREVDGFLNGSAIDSSEIPTDGLSAGDYRVRVIDDATGNEITAQTATISVLNQGTPSVSFDETELTTEQGDRVAIDIDFDNTTKAKVIIGDEGSNYQIEFTVIDRPKAGNQLPDGEATVYFNTVNAGSLNAPGVPIHAVGADTVIISEYEMGSTLDQASYAVLMNHGDGETAPYDFDEVRSSPNNIATLNVQPNIDASVKTWTAPEASSINAITSLAAVSNTVASGALTQDSSIALSGAVGDEVAGNGVADETGEVGDLVVLDIDVSGIHGVLEDIDGDPFDSVTMADVLEAQNDGFLSLRLQQTEASTELNQEQLTVDLAESEANGAFQVVTSDVENKIYIVMDPEQVNYVEDTVDADAQADAGDVWDVSFAADLPEFQDQPAPDFGGDTDVSATTQFEFVAGQVALTEVQTGQTSYDFKGTIRALENQDTVVSASSTWAPGTSIQLRVQSNSGVTPAFFEQKTYTVSADGTFQSTWSVFDTDGMPDSPFTLTVSQPGPSNNVPVPGEVQDVVTTSTVTFNDQSTNGEVVEVESAYLEDGGYVVIHAATSSGAPGEVLGASGYIPAGTADNIDINLSASIDANQELIAMTHKDTDGDQNYDFPAADGPYMIHDSDNDGAAAVIDSAQITVRQPNFAVSGLSAPSSVTVGDTVTVTATISNEGDGTGTQTVEFRLGGETLFTNNVTLTPGGSTTVTFSVPTSGVSAGSYTHGVFVGNNSQTASLTVNPQTTTTTETTTTEPTETTTEPTETEPPADDTTTDGAGSPGFGVTAAIVALLGAALLALRRRA